jgi:hypothetical protein
MPSSSNSSKSRRSSSASTKKSALKKKSILKRSATRKANRRVRIRSPKNQIREYSLGSEEKRWKQGSPSKRGVICGSGIFPCVYRGVVFEDASEWDEYKENMISRNESTGYRSISSHKRSTMSALSKKGKSAKKIPEDFRLYNNQTGEIFDMRNLDPDSITYKPLK